MTENDRVRPIKEGGMGNSEVMLFALTGLILFSCIHVYVQVISYFVPDYLLYETLRQGIWDTHEVKMLKNNIQWV